MEQVVEDTWNTAEAAPRAPVRAPSSLRRHDILELPMQKRMVVQYAINEEGLRELRLFHGDKEVSFDEPALFPFGEALARQTRFCADAATAWGPGYAWNLVAGYLETLIDEGILRVADAGPQSATPESRHRPSPLPPATCPHARDWSEAEEITRELAGRPVEAGYLELFVPVFRVAHIAMDADGRHVGEANVFPRRLRTDTPTEWMSCIYAGSRYKSEKPMNVTALKAMREHWPQMMAVLLRIRAAFLRRCPRRGDAWTVGEIERLATTILCVPTYQLVKGFGAAPNGELHPCLSSLFRVTDGLRLVMHEMLFVPIGEPTRSPNAIVTVEEIHEYAERNYSFHSDTGVCAGPRHMVREFLDVVLDGADSDRYADMALAPQVASALADVDAAMDYALLGLQAYSLTYSMWPLMFRTYERIAGIARNAVASGAVSFTPFDARMTDRLRLARTSQFLSLESLRADRDRVYADMFEKCGAALEAIRQRISFQAVTRPMPDDEIAAAERQLESVLRHRFGTDDAAAPHIAALQACVMDSVARTQSLLREAARTQQHINRLLKRQQPRRALNALDIDVHNRLQGIDEHSLPFLLDELAEAFGIDIQVHANGVSFVDRRTA